MSIAKAVRENFEVTGTIEVPGNERAAAFNFGEPGSGKFALVFSDGSELSMSITKSQIQGAFSSPAGESDYQLVI